MSEWIDYTLHTDRDLPEGERRRVEVKELTVRDSLILGKSRDQLAHYVASHVDKDLRDDVAELEYGHLVNIAKIMLGSRNYRGFEGGEEQTPLEAFLNAKPGVGLSPPWMADVLAAIFDANELSEDEEKNSATP